MKTEILEAIGEYALIRPAEVSAGLIANERAKYLLSLLQMAVVASGQESAASGPVETLRAEREAAGIEEPALDEIIPASRRESGRVRVPGAAKVLARLKGQVQAMAAPMLNAGNAAFAPRLEALLGGLPDAEGGLVEGSEILKLAEAGPGDSLHRLIMDLHKALNVMQAELAEERLDGAAVWGLEPGDRALVAAFMAGVKRTAGLKFNHLGLGTNAMRAGERLVIQNDIGLTDAHVIVVQVRGLDVDLTYSDVHPERSEFLRALLGRFRVAWSGEESRRAAGLSEGGEFRLMTGRFAAKDEAELKAYLEFLGSRLVFLIDWNRARKQLRSFLPAKARGRLLRWAAEQEVGHRAFLQLDGARLVNEAIEAVGGSAIHFGDRLSDVLGLDAAEEFLRFVLQAASVGLLTGQSTSLIRDRIRTDLARHFSNEAYRLLSLAAEHAGQIFEIALAVREAMASLEEVAGEDGHLARVAKLFEHDADVQVERVRGIVGRRPDLASFLPILEAADDAADQLEEATFLLGLLAQRPPGGKTLEELGRLAELVLQAAQEWVKALAHAMALDHPTRAGQGKQEDADDFLTAIEAIATLEHQADDAERALTVATVREAADHRQLYLAAGVGAGLEAAADALRHASALTRQQVLGGILGA